MSRLVLPLLLWSTSAFALPQRLALVVGNNQGNGRATLQFAETDAAKVATVFTSVAGVDPHNLQLLEGKKLSDIEASFAWAKRVIASYQLRDAHVTLLFYFSGHSDGESLEIGDEHLSFAHLKERLHDTGADTRVVVIDSCQSGALINAKGSSVASGFHIQLADDLSSRGEAILTSSTAFESSLESRAIGGSIFTHHFLSGLRGAADKTGDGRITLAEAYSYAFDHTVAETADIVSGSQHPAYDYQLSGKGDLVLSTPGEARALLRFPPGYSRFLVTDQSEHVIAELSGTGSGQLALEPGGYSIHAWKKNEVSVGVVSLFEGEARSIEPSDLVAVAPNSDAARKGDRAPQLLMAAAGISHGVAVDLPVVVALRAGWRQGRAQGWAVSLDANVGRVQGGTETASFALAGYRFGLDSRYLSGFVGLEAGPGAIFQAAAGHTLAWSPMFALAPWIGGAAWVTANFSFVLEADMPVALLRESAKAAVQLFPAVRLGLQYAL